jgi:predicted nuclease with RNAse H fold
MAQMPDTTTDRVAEAFAELVKALRVAAIDAPLTSEREAAYLQAVRRMAERWAAGEASPVRAAKKDAA